MRLLAERTGFVLEKLETRSVRSYEKDDVPDAIYRLAKIVTEVLNVPARLLGHGHDMLALMRRSGV